MCRESTLEALRGEMRGSVWCVNDSTEWAGDDENPLSNAPIHVRTRFSLRPRARAAE